MNNVREYKKYQKVELECHCEVCNRDTRTSALIPVIPADGHETPSFLI